MKIGSSKLFFINYLLSIGALIFSVSSFYFYLRMSTAFDALNQSPIIIDKQVFSLFEHSIDSKLGAATSIISIGATVIGTIVAFLALYSTVKIDNAEKELKEKIDEFDKKYSWVNIIPYISLGNYNKLSGNNIYAKNDYEAAHLIDEENVFVNYFLGVHYADLYTELTSKNKASKQNFTQLLDKAQDHIHTAIISLENSDCRTKQEKKEQGIKEILIKSELYTTMGSIYGLYGKKLYDQQKNSILEENMKKYFKRSIQYFNNALEFSNKSPRKKFNVFDVNNSENFVGLGISYAYLFQVSGESSFLDELYKSFERAIYEDQNSLSKKYTKKNLPWDDIQRNRYLMNSQIEGKLICLEQKYFGSKRKSVS